MIFDDRRDRLGVRQAEQYDIGQFGQALDRFAGDRARFDHRDELVRRSVPDVNVEARIEQAQGHRFAHQADADESESEFLIRHT
ncbi:MAG: hypothetical protein Kow0065_09530 [Methylomicrobium sp.]